MNKIKALFVSLLKGISVLIMFLIISSVVILALNIRIELGFLNKPVELAVEKMLNRDFSMQGEVVLIPTLWPTLEIHDVSIANPYPDADARKKSQWKQNEFAHFGQLRLQLGLTPLLSGEIHIADVLAEKVSLNLESNMNGEPNWVFDLPEKQQASKTDSVDERQQLFHFEALDGIVLRDININYIDQSINKNINFNLQKLSGEAQSGKDIKLEFNGKLQDKAFSAQLNGGALRLFRDEQKNWPLKMTIIVAGTKIRLSGDLLREKVKEPELSALLEIGKTDIGATLSWLKIIKGLDVHSEKLTMQINLKGQTLAQLLTDSALDITLKNARWNIVEKNTGGVLPIKISTGTIKVEPGKPAAVQLNGLLAQSKVNIMLTGAPAIDYIHDTIKTPLKISLQTHDTHVQLSSRISKNMNVRNLGFNLLFKGNNLSDLNQLTHMDLPPLGPYSLRGYFAVNNKGYQIKNLLLQVKDSHLKGNFNFDTRAKPPYVMIDLHSKTIQINDFDVAEWSPVTEHNSKDAEISDSKGKSRKINKLKKIEIDNKKKAAKLLSHDTLSRFNADISLKVDQVLSGNDVLGNALITIKQKNARFDLKLKKLTLPGGDAYAYFSYYPEGNKQIDMSLDVQVKSFDYGVLARRIDKKSAVGGRVSLDIQLASKNINSLNSLLTQSEGHIDFAWSPKALDAGLFELWAVNLMTSLLESADDEKASKVNCVIGRFVLNQGIMQDKVIFVDSTKMRMMGTAKANFQNRSIQVNLTPQAKRPEFFSLATSVALTGTFDDFHISLNPLSVTATAVSFITSPLHVPVRRLFAKGLPEDGYEACKVMWDVSDEIDDKAKK